MLNEHRHTGAWHSMRHHNYACVLVVNFSPPHAVTWLGNNGGIDIPSLMAVGGYMPTIRGWMVITACVNFVLAQLNKAATPCSHTEE